MANNNNGYEGLSRRSIRNKPPYSSLDTKAENPPWLPTIETVKRMQEEKQTLIQKANKIQPAIGQQYYIEGWEYLYHGPYTLDNRPLRERVMNGPIEITNIFPLSQFMYMKANKSQAKQSIFSGMISGAKSILSKKEEPYIASLPTEFWSEWILELTPRLSNELAKYYNGADVFYVTYSYWKTIPRTLLDENIQKGGKKVKKNQTRKRR